MAHLPKFNVTSIQETNNKYSVKPIKKLQFIQMIDNPIKLIEFSNSLNEVNRELKESEDNTLHNKYFIYPVGSVTIIAIILVIVEITLCFSKK